MTVGLTTKEGLAGPKRAARTFCAALSAGDLERACACFTLEACLVTPDGTAVKGRGAIRPILAQLIASRAQLSVEISAVLQAGDVAIAHERWQIRTGDGAAAFTRSSKPTLVLQRIELDWKLAVAAPWGWGSGFSG